jgi:hypothetical protein
MQKKLFHALFLVLIGPLLFVPGQSLATKARMQALGQDKERGPLYFYDGRSFFLNAAAVNFDPNLIVTEWGSSNNNTDTLDNPKGEGGFFQNYGPFILGAYFGREYSGRNSLRLGTSNSLFNDSSDIVFDTGEVYGNPAFLPRDNPIDVVFGGDAGFLWGIRFDFAFNNNNTIGIKKNNSSFGIGIGFIFPEHSFYGNLGILDKSKGALNQEDEWTSDLYINLGGTFKIGPLTLFIDYEKEGSEYRVETVSFSNTTTEKNIKVGFGRVFDFESSKLYSDLTFHYREIIGRIGNLGKRQSEIYQVPLTLGIEVKARPWLYLRGSVSQNFFLGRERVSTSPKGQVPEGVKNLENSINVNAGLTFKFYNLSIDGLIGTTGKSRAGGGQENSGVLSLDNLISRVGIEFKF